MSICCGRAQSVCNVIARVKVIGDGNEDSRAQLKNMEEAIEAIGMNILLDDLPIDSLKEYNATKVPAIIVGTKLISEGTLLSKDESIAKLRKAILGI